MKSFQPLLGMAALASCLVSVPVAVAADASKKLHHVASDAEEGDLASSKTYVSVFEYGENIGISYGLFYPHNGDIFLSQGSGGDLGDAICWITPALCNVVDWVAGDEGVHEGDWENVKVVINKNSGEIVDVYISAHHNEGGWYPLSDYNTENGRAVVYSALKSHANYRTTGLQTRIEETYGTANDQTDRGTLWQLKDHISLIGGDYDTNNLYPWLSYNGRWGGTDEAGLSNTNSPGGKKFNKSWFVNWVEEHQSVDISTGDLRDLVKHQYADALDLATTYAPRIYLHSDEELMPSSIPWYLDRVKLTVDDNTTLDMGELNQWTLVDKSEPLVRDLGLFSQNNSTLEATNEKYNNQNVWKIVTNGVDGYLQNVAAGATFTPNDKVYEFSINLKAEPGTTALVTLRLRDKERENIVEQDFVVTDQWQKYAINSQFPGEHSGLSMFIYPAGKVAGNQGHVYAADAQLNRITSYYKTIAQRRWIKHNSMVGQGVCADGGILLPSGIVSDECDATGRFYTWEQAQTACPVGYQLPSVDEYLALFDVTGGADNLAGNMLKSTDFGLGTDDYGFNAIGAGWANPDSTVLNNRGIEAVFWTRTEHPTDSSQGARVFLQAQNAQIPWAPDHYAYRDKGKRYSVRCVK